MITIPIRLFSYLIELEGFDRRIVPVYKEFLGTYMTKSKYGCHIYLIDIYSFNTIRYVELGSHITRIVRINSKGVSTSSSDFNVYTFSFSKFYTMTKKANGKGASYSNEYLLYISKLIFYYEFNGKINSLLAKPYPLNKSLLSHYSISNGLYKASSKVRQDIKELEASYPLDSLTKTVFKAHVFQVWDVEYPPLGGVKVSESFG